MNRNTISNITAKLRHATKPLLLVLCALAGAAGGAGGMYLAREQVGPVPTTKQELAERRAGEVTGHDRHGEHEEGVVYFPKAKWSSAGIEIAQAQRGSFTQTKWVTGKLVLNEDRLAHIYSLVEGIVHEVRVRFGDQVRKGEVLAVIDSRDVGQAKLELVKNQLSVRIATVNHEWNQKIYKNTQALIQAMEQQIPTAEIEERFHDQSMGEYRQQLVSAYARLHQARADYQRLKTLTEKGITREADLIKANADYEAARATNLAWLEQIKFTAWQQFLASQQALEQAKLAEGISRSSLYILGYHEDEVSRRDPLSEGEEVAHYLIEAPFDGTVISKDVVFDERVGPDTKLFDIADLSSVWLQADIYEQDLPLLAGLRSQQLRFRSAAYPDQPSYAQVFYAGDIVDEKTRTVRLMAVTKNPNGQLKPGTFVNVELPARTLSDVLQVPASAVVEHEKETFVFVAKGGDKFERRDVVLGHASDATVEIREGLKPGELVVVAGTFALKSEMLRGKLAEGGHSH